MWQYRCPVCNELIQEKDKGKPEVSKLVRHSHKCPKCGGMLYVSEGGHCLDLGEMLIKALELSTGIILPKEEVLSHYIDA